MNARELGFKPAPSDPSCYYPTSTEWRDPWGQFAFKVEPDGPPCFDMKLELWARQTARSPYRNDEAKALAAKILEQCAQERAA